VRRLTPDTRDALTPQELQVARLTRDGHRARNYAARKNYVGLSPT
jgi:hypothetical protein